MIFDKPILIQKQDEETLTWSDYIKLHANVNKSDQKEDFQAGATQNKRTLRFIVRYCKPLADLADNIQIYRVVYRNVNYNIVDTDDYMEEHKTLTLIGESY